jgi:hypothetical protein
MPNGRCRMHGGKNPGAPKGNTNAYKTGRYSARVMAETAALHKKANALMVEAIHACTDVARKLRRGLLPPEEADRRYEAIKAQIARAFALRKEAIALKYTWPDRYHGRRED